MPVVARDPASHSSEVTPHEGVWIANGRGAPGTVACVVRQRVDDHTVILGSHHVLLGADAHARAREVISLLLPTDPAPTPIGYTRYGRFGTVEHDGCVYHIDCAVASLERAPSDLLARLASSSACAMVGWAVAGETVCKTGAATGATTGTVTDVEYTDELIVNGAPTIAPRQLLIRSVVREIPFSAPGDSGSLVRNARGEGVAMLTGITARGDSVACHLAPVFHVLHLRC